MQPCWKLWRMWSGDSALQMRCFMQGCLGSLPQLERGALGSAVIDGGGKMKLLAIWFCGNRSMAKGASEDRLAHLSICWRRTPGSPETACRQRWMPGLAGERNPGGEGVDWGPPNSSSTSKFLIPARRIFLHTPTLLQLYSTSFDLLEGRTVMLLQWPQGKGHSKAVMLWCLPGNTDHNAECLLLLRGTLEHHVGGSAAVDVLLSWRLLCMGTSQTHQPWTSCTCRH